MLQFIFLILTILCFQSSYALTLVAGEQVGRQAETAIYEPLDWILNLKYDPYRKNELQSKAVAYNYIGFLREGMNLENSCSKQRHLLYKTPFELDQVKRSVLSTLQYIGLDFTTKAIANYSNDFDLSDNEYDNLVDNLIVNNCSKNTTVISLKQLRNNFYLFKKRPAGGLPTIKNSLKFFPKKLLSHIESRDGRKREFYLTTHLFKAFCSWGNDASQLRFLTPLVRNPFIMAYINREMAGMGLAYDSDFDRYELRKQSGRVRVNCAAQICRRASDLNFEEKLPRSIGSLGLIDDFNRLYCGVFRQQSYQKSDEDNRISAQLSEREMDEEKLVQSQLVSLLTGVPDTLINLAKFDDGKKVFQASVEDHWDLWSKQAIKNLMNKLSYEESLTLTPVPRYLTVNPFEAKFRVVMEVTLGELDRINYVVDKISVDQKIVISKSFLKYMRKKWVSRDHRIIATRTEVIDRFSTQLLPEINRIKKKFIVAPWNEGLERVVAMELLEQLAQYEGTFFNEDSNDSVVIPLEFRYGQFALRYLKYRFEKLALRK
jgi:hypothetical protein